MPYGADTTTADCIRSCDGDRSILLHDHGRAFLAVTGLVQTVRHSALAFSNAHPVSMQLDPAWRRPL